MQHTVEKKKKQKKKEEEEKKAYSSCTSFLLFTLCRFYYVA